MGLEEVSHPNPMELSRNNVVHKKPNVPEAESSEMLPFDTGRRMQYTPLVANEKQLWGAAACMHPWCQAHDNICRGQQLSC